MLNSALSSYWFIVCIIIGLAYAYFLYAYGSKPWPKRWNVLLFILRFAAVTLISYLFLEPFLSSRVSEAEKAKVIILWDNSQSVKRSAGAEQIHEIWTNVQDVRRQLQEGKEVQVNILNLKGEDISEQDSVQQSASESPLDPALKQISRQYNNELIAEVVLFSDGIFNRGISPDYFAYPFSLSTVGVGDTSEKKDVELKNLRYNKVSYQGNKFPVVAEIVQSGWKDQSTTIGIYKNDQLIQQKSLDFEEGNSVITERFILEADEKGFQSYSVRVEPFEEEFNKENNEQSIYINVIEGKKKVLLLAPAPHPDISALKQTISQNENYDLDITVAGLHEYSQQKYDLAILFHLPNVKNVFQAEIAALSKQKVPLWFIAGAGMDVNTFNQLNNSIDLQAWSDTDQATAYINPDFNKFDITSEQKKQLKMLPPVEVPFADYRLSPLADVLLFKQIGSVKTDHPILIFYADDESKQATLLMEGFWKWRLVEHLNTGNYHFFNEWVMKSVRYLTTESEKNQFKIYPVKQEFSSAEQVLFKVEQYNEVYDRIYGQPVSLQLRNEADSTFSYRFTPDRVQPDFEVGSLPAGVYRYNAETEIAGTKHTAAGQFVVSDFNIEQQNITADFELLRRVANKNDGEFFHANKMNELLEYLNNRDYPKILTGKTEKTPLTESFWLYGLIFFMLFLEWFLRRYHGSY